MCIVLFLMMSSIAVACTIQPFSSPIRSSGVSCPTKGSSATFRQYSTRCWLQAGVHGRTRFCMAWITAVVVKRTFTSDWTPANLSTASWLFDIWTRKTSRVSGSEALQPCRWEDGNEARPLCRFHPPDSFAKLPPFSMWDSGHANRSGPFCFWMSPRPSYSTPLPSSAGFIRPILFRSLLLDFPCAKRSRPFVFEYPLCIFAVGWRITHRMKKWRCFVLSELWAGPSV